MAPTPTTTRATIADFKHATGAGPANYQSATTDSFRRLVRLHFNSSVTTSLLRGRRLEADSSPDVEPWCSVRIRTCQVRFCRQYRCHQRTAASRPNATIPACFPPAEPAELTSHSPSDKNNWGPRFGFAWDTLAPVKRWFAAVTEFTTAASLTRMCCRPTLHLEIRQVRPVTAITPKTNLGKLHAART